jgi:tetratricopeptide (TPR) repeat protein
MALVIGLVAGLAGGLVPACGGRAPAPSEKPAPATQTLIAQAEAAEKARRYDRADALYTRARTEAPDAPSQAMAAVAHGRALIFWGEYERASAALEDATQHAPGDAGAWHDLGMVRHQLGDLAGAEVAFRRSITASPRDGRPRLALAALLWKQRRHQHALHEYEALATLDLPERVHDRVLWAIGTLRRLVATP